MISDLCLFLSGDYGGGGGDACPSRFPLGIIRPKGRADLRSKQRMGEIVLPIQINLKKRI